MTPTEERNFDLIWNAGHAMHTGNWAEFRQLTPSVVSALCDTIVAPETEPTKREAVRYYRGLLMMTDAELEAARVAS